ncbi:MAG: adenosylcobinamide-GDP ribazoletransferase [Candidatus Aquilonibacter sp.]
MRFLRALAAAFSYFSILPIPHSEEPPSDGAIGLLPIVGAVIGALAGYSAYGIALLTHSQLAAAITAWVLSIALSGAIHVDGFLDCCDGLLAMAPPEKRLAIMRDPHHGTYAIVGTAIISVLWLYALAQIPRAMLPAVLAITGFFARGLTLAVLRPSKWIPSPVALLIGIVTVVPWLFGLFAKRRLGGVLNGDCYGAAIVVTEIALLIISAVSTSRGPGLLR